MFEPTVKGLRCRLCHKTAVILRSSVIISILITASANVVWPEEGADSYCTTCTDESDKTAIDAAGTLRADYFSTSRTLDDERDFYGLTAQLRLKAILSDSSDGKMEARFYSPDNGADPRMPSKASLTESYVNLHAGRLDLRIGKQNVAWGRADAINPTDNLTPSDYTVLLPFDEDRRFGTTSITLNVHVSEEHTIIIYATTLFEPSVIPLPLPGGAVVSDKRLPARALSNAAVGLKFNKSGGNVDWSVSCYHGFSLMPEVRLEGFQPPSNILIALSYPEVYVLGADIARNFGRYGFRAEAAYISPMDYNDGESTAIRPYLFYVFGFDRAFLDNLYANLQIVGRWIPSYRNIDSIPDPLLRSIAVDNAIIFGQRHRSNYGLTSRISGKWFNDLLEVQLLSIIYLSPSNAYLRPLLTYAISDHIKGSIGGELYVGPPESFFGSIERNKGMFFELRYAF